MDVIKSQYCLNSFGNNTKYYFETSADQVVTKDGKLTDTITRLENGGVIPGEHEKIDLSDYYNIEDVDNIINNINNAITNLNVKTNNINNVNVKIGDLNELSTLDKDNLVEAINEVFQSVSNGKQLIAAAITDKGVESSSNQSFEQLSNSILNISGEDMYGKSKILEILYQKLPSLSSKLTPESTLSEIAFYIGLIGELLIYKVELIKAIKLSKLADKINLNIVTKYDQNLIMLNDVGNNLEEKININIIKNNHIPKLQINTISDNKNIYNMEAN